MSKLTKSKIRKLLDKAWSAQIRSCGKCVKCGKTSYLNAHHIYGRRMLSVRWDLDNGICLCSGCHTLCGDSAHQDPMTFYEFIVDLKGEEWLDELRLKAHSTKKWTLEELEDLLEVLNEDNT